MKKFFYLILTAVTALSPINGITAFAASNEVKIDQKDVSADAVVITEAEGGMFQKGQIILLAVEKIEGYGDIVCKTSKGDIEASAELLDRDGVLRFFKDSPNFDSIKKNLSDSCTYLAVTIDDESTEPSEITVSGLKLYLDRTLPQGDYALKEQYTGMGIWENTASDKNDADTNGVFKYKPITAKEDYVHVVTAPRDKDDYVLDRDVSVGIGSEEITAGGDTIMLDAPAYINSENYTMLPARAIAEALGATVSWNEESRTVSIFSGQRIVSMTIGSKTMYINGTPVQMNTAAEITNGRTFIPVRDMANALGIRNVDWDEKTKTVTLN